MAISWMSELRPGSGLVLGILATVLPDWPQSPEDWPWSPQDWPRSPQDWPWSLQDWGSGLTSGVWTDIGCLDWGRVSGLGSDDWTGIGCLD